MNKELKPCPFCGEQPDIETGKGGNVWITCGCGASVASIVSDDDATDGWNTRAYEPELQSLRAENERLKAEAEFIRIEALSDAAAKLRATKFDGKSRDWIAGHKTAAEFIDVDSEFARMEWFMTQTKYILDVEDRALKKALKMLSKDSNNE